MVKLRSYVIVALAIAIVVVFGASIVIYNNRQAKVIVADPIKEQYVIMAHTVIPAHDLEMPADEYTIKYGAEILKVRYSDSQTSSAEPKDFPGTGLHMHSRYSNPDLSQVPPAGVPIRACLMDQKRDKNGDLVIAKQPTNEPCIARIGDRLQYEPSPNGPIFFTFVAFDILSESIRN
jgi:hypothetical protein